MHTPQRCGGGAGFFKIGAVRSDDRSKGDSCALCESILLTFGIGHRRSYYYRLLYLWSRVMTVAEILGCASATNKRLKHDAYQTPDWVVEQLCEVERLPSQIWEPCAGEGQLANVLRQHGSKVIETDLDPRKRSQRRLDFLAARRPLSRPSSPIHPIALPPSSSGTRYLWVSNISPCCSRRISSTPKSAMNGVNPAESLS
jgi:hypothetical protein